MMSEVVRDNIVLIYNAIVKYTKYKSYLFSQVASRQSQRLLVYRCVEVRGAFNEDALEVFMHTYSSTE